MRYGREVHRKALDMYFHLGASLRCVAEWLRGEVAPGAGRSRHWRPWADSAGGDEPGARLSHVSIWRWEMAAGRRARTRRLERAWSGVMVFCGAVVADATAVCIRGLWHSVHTLHDAVSRVSMQLERLTETGEVPATLVAARPARPDRECHHRRSRSRGLVMSPPQFPMSRGPLWTDCGRMHPGPTAKSHGGIDPFPQERGPALAPMTLRTVRLHRCAPGEHDRSHTQSLSPPARPGPVPR